MTDITTNNRARSDVIDAGPTGEAGRAAGSGRSWALAGVGSALAGLATVVTSAMVDTVYGAQFIGNIDGVAQALAGKVPVMLTFHSVTVVGALLMVVFAAGLLRRLGEVMPDSIAPMVAFSGLLGTAVLSVLGSGLDTEYIYGLGLTSGQVLADDATAAIYNHWIGTIPWVWVLVGLSGLALFAAFRQGVAPRWLGLVGLLLGGLTALLGISPLQYLAAISGIVWLLATSIGFTVGDRKHRAGGR